VTWDGPDDPTNPYNWSSRRKIAMAITISLGQLVCLMTTSVVAPALPQMASDLRLGESETQISFSIFVLGQAFGPFLIGPLSEVFGRKPMWIGGNIFYIVWNTLCPVGKSKAMLVVGRFLAGAGASSGVNLSGPIMADMYRKEDRGKSLAIATLFPYLGPALGPIVGGLVSQHVSWPWLFWVMSIFDAVVVISGFLIVRESFKPILLQRKEADLRRKGATIATNENDPSEQNLLPKIRASLIRPLRLLLTRPIIQILALIMALGFGIYVLVLSFFARVFIDQYNESATTSSLQYISIALGSTLATQAGGRLMDIVYSRLHARQPDGTPAPPEFRVPLLLVGVFLLPVGLFWLGWSAQDHIKWIMVDIGAVIFTAGDFLASQAALAYLLDEFPNHSASAGAAVRMLSNILGFAFPLFAPQLYDKLGYGWGNSLLAFVWIVIAIPVPVVLWFWGTNIRPIGRTKEYQEEH
ncbi:major facilitator superfamily domain-containing protein, partial [Talaromyces proteolyticus]